MAPPTTGSGDSHVFRLAVRFSATAASAGITHYISDTLQGVLGALALLESAPAPRVDTRFDIFNLGESRTVALTQLVALTAGELGIAPQWQRLLGQPGEVECTFADISKARTALGCNSQVAIEEGLRKFVQWFRNQLPAQEKIS